jgi:hypothetical protein
MMIEEPAITHNDPEMHDNATKKNVCWCGIDRRRAGPRRCCYSLMVLLYRATAHASRKMRVRPARSKCDSRTYVPSLGHKKPRNEMVIGWPLSSGWTNGNFFPNMWSEWLQDTAKGYRTLFIKVSWQKQTSPHSTKKTHMHTHKNMYYAPILGE